MTLSRLDRRYGSAVRAVWASVLGRVGRSWSGLGSWREADALRFQRQALPIILAGERQVANLTASYLEQLYRDQADEVHRVAVDLDAVTGHSLRGVDPEEVYLRPFKEVWTALSNDVSLDDALHRGARRLETLVQTDLQLARTHTVREVAADMPRFEYTVRVLQGEYDCALCMIASTQRYRKRDLAPIHPGCDCLVKAVTAEYDPGQVIDEELLDAIHDAVKEAVGTSDRGGRAVDYRQILLTREHGEMGPLLTFRDQHFTGPDEIAPDRPAHASSPTMSVVDEDRLGETIASGDASPAVGDVLRRTVDVIAQVHRVDADMPEIPLKDEHRDGYLGSYVRTRGGDSVRFTVNPAGPWPMLTSAHELGHFLDHKALGSDPSQMATDVEIGPGGLLSGWWSAVQDTAVYQVLQFMRQYSEDDVWSTIERNGEVQAFKVDHTYLDYLMSPTEVFARTYAQWIAIRSGDSTLLDELERASDPGLGATLLSGFTPGYPRQWADDDFEAVATELDDLFDELGWLITEGSDDA